MLRAFITGVAGTRLSPEEQALLNHARPCGLILFSRNCEAFDQIRDLIADVVDAVGADILVLIDQEGGRVQRLRPPLGRALPPAAAFAALYDRDPDQACDAAYQVARLVAHDLRILSINTNCAPVLDLPSPEGHEIIGDRALGRDPVTVSALGRAMATGFLAGGVLPVIKHIPGHGRARDDSHKKLPVVETPRESLQQSDFVPFKQLSDLPLAMTAHVTFTDLDEARPASTSAIVTQKIIREWIGFDGLLMSDDLSMQALEGTMEARTEAVLAAGSDVALHCNGDLMEMRAVARTAPVLSGGALKRYEMARSLGQQRQPFDQEAAEAILNSVLTASRETSESV